MSARAGRTALAALVCLGFLAMAAAIALDVPPNMDEALPYQPIACGAFAEAKAQVFREACGAYDLRIAGKWLPARAFPYIGAASAAFYLPVYLVWPHWISARLLGVASVLLSVAGAAALSGTGFLAALAVVGLFFPLAYQAIADTGPLGFQCALVFWLPVLMRRVALAASPARRAGWSLALGFLAFLGVEEKPFFALVLPGVALVGASVAREAAGESWRRFAARAPERFAAGLAAFAFPSWLVFTAPTRWQDAPYWQELVFRGRSYDWTELAAQLSRLLEHGRDYLANFGGFAHRVYGPATWQTVPATLVAWSALAWALARGRRRAGPFVAAAALTLLLVNRTAAAWAGHHFVFVPLFLVAGALPALAGRRGVAAVAALCLASAALLAQTLAREPRPDSNWERLDAFRVVDEPGFARSHLVSHLDWGTFSLDALYGPPEQLVTYNEPIRSLAELRAVERVARERGRRLAFVVRRDSVSDWALVRRELPELRRLWPSPGATSSVWQVWAEP